MRWVALAVVAALACPVTASAGIAQVEPGTGEGRSAEPVEFVRYRAGPGEQNDVRAGITLDRAGGGTATLRDLAGATPGPGCARPNPADLQLVSCRLGSPEGPSVASYAFDFQLGDRDDSAAITYGPLAGRFDGGAGSDTLTAGNGIGSPTEEDGPYGPEGGDLTGGPGDDTLVGGSRADTFQSDGPDGADVMRAGRGIDSVSYVGRRARVHADLAGDADDGARGERDRIVDAENLFGGAGKDTLTGDAKPNDIDGGGGGDRIAGRGGSDRIHVGDDDVNAGPERLSGGGGDDYLVGGPAGDRIDAGPGVDVVEARGGNDRIRARDRDTDQLSCQRGRDSVSVDARDFADRACERIRRRGTARAVVLGQGAGPLGHRGRPYTDTDIGCSPDVPVGRCRVSVTVSRRGTILGRDRLTVRRGTSNTSFVYLNRAGRLLVRRLGDRGTTTVRVTAVIRTAKGRRLAASRVLELEGLSG